LLCDTLLREGKKNFSMYDDETQGVFLSWCEGKGAYVKPSMDMMSWLDKTLKDQSADPDIIWKASSQHYPLFGMHYTDTEMIVTHLMPLLKEHGYDVYFNGHEHMMNYAHAPDSLFKESKAESEAISLWQRI